ncbi:MAG: hybrid sensor histidine kinase/response regulator [Methylovulum miyakonense]|uniref:ATP-binding response regulator n=1 Tax=Methylovulum miyakonense TaxID=645578 RepID=UPI003BB5A614
MVWTLLLWYLFTGVLWGILPWLTLDAATPAGRVLVIMVLAVLPAGAISALSPVLPVYLAFVVPELVSLALKLWLLDDSAYHALAALCMVYLFTLQGHARNASRTIRSFIELRYENIELVDQLRVEKTIVEKAHQEAEQANIAKSKFLAAASHDLRQPIHAQGLFLEVLALGELSAKQREVLMHARAASEASAEMLNTLLDFSRIDAGVVEPKRGRYPLQALFNKLENELAPQANAKDLVYRSRETGAVVHSDPVLVELILRNLVTNAIRYTDRGGVLVVCRPRKNKGADVAVVEVWDTGIGIAPALQQDVFREFCQLGNPERDRRKGLGLGLAIADGLARVLGHEISLQSRPERGSVFRLVLPKADATPLFDETTAIPEEKTGHAAMLDVRVLVIDDDESVRTGMLHLLRDWGCDCDAVESIDEALSLIQTRPPGLVISDFRLCDKRTGAEAIEALRAVLGKQLPALLITGDTAPSRLRDAQASGLPLLHKPVSPDQLYQELLTVLDQAALLSICPARPLHPILPRACNELNLEQTRH